VRGNPTAISSYTNGSSFLTKTFTYFDTGNVQTASDVNGAQTTFTYGACGNSFPTRVDEPLGMWRTMTWNCTGGVMDSSTDENRQPTSIIYNDPYFWRPASENFADGGQTSWTYNSPTSITTTTKMTSTQNIVSTVLLDGLGRTSQTQLNSDPQGVVKIDTTYDSLGRIATVKNPYRTTSDPTYGVTSYVYDARGRRVQKTVGSTQTQYMYDLDGNVISERDQNNWKNAYLRLNGRLFAQYTIGAPRTEFIHSDHLGSTRLVTSFVPGTPPTYSIYDTFDYLPFGEQTLGGTSTTHKFTGDEHDSETNPGLDHTWFRQYSSSSGRWMTPDPLGINAADATNPQSWNGYVYVHNYPLNRIDPLGMNEYGGCDAAEGNCGAFDWMGGGGGGGGGFDFGGGGGGGGNHLGRRSGSTICRRVRSIL
jgi:RHS repeat-associated protein